LAVGLAVGLLGDFGVGVAGVFVPADPVLLAFVPGDPVLSVGVLSDGVLSDGILSGPDTAEPAGADPVPGDPPPASALFAEDGFAGGRTVRLVFEAGRR
jgi:hypothetical protein